MDLHRIVAIYKNLARDLGRTPTRREAENLTKLTRRQIYKHGHNNLCKKAGLDINRNPQQRPRFELEYRPPKIFCFDLEVLAMIVKSYGLWKQNIRPSRIQEDYAILSWAGRFLDEKKMHYHDTRGKKDPRNDKEVVKKLHEQLMKADIVLGHNSDKFDIKRVNAKFVEYGLKPVRFDKKIDTLKIARKYFKFSSNSLDYVAKKLGCTPKRKGRKFTNEEMWDECERGNVKAYKENEKYNKQDVETTIEVFDKLKSWDESLNFQTYYGKTVCVCGSEKFKKAGFKRTKQSAYQQYACAKCGKYFSGKKNLISKEVRREFKK